MIKGLFLTLSAALCNNYRKMNSLSAVLYGTGRKVYPMLIYKVVEINTVTDEELESAINQWVKKK